MKSIATFVVASLLALTLANPVYGATLDAVFEQFRQTLDVARSMPNEYLQRNQAVKEKYALLMAEFQEILNWSLRFYIAGVDIPDEAVAHMKTLVAQLLILLQRSKGTSI